MPRQGAPIIEQILLAVAEPGEMPFGTVCVSGAGSGEAISPTMRSDEARYELQAG